MMATTRELLAGMDQQLAESMGERTSEATLRLAPSPRPADAGRRPAPQFGRIDIDRVMPDPDQPRSEFDAEAIDRLATSLRDAGQLAPIRARWSEDHQKWLIVAGERRWRAASRAGLTTIECYFYESELAAGEVLRLQMVENLLRENLKPMEEARGFRRLMELNGSTGKQVAAELSVPESKVSRSLALLRLPEDVQQQVDAGRIAPRVAYEIARAPTTIEQRRLASLAAAGGIKLADVAKRVRRKKRTGGKADGGVKLTFPLEEGWTIVVSRQRPGSYHEVEQALEWALDEVRTRIRANIRL